MKQSDNPRFISRLTRETIALILAGGRGSRLYELTKWRAKPALYFGGKFRIIDFPLSNCVNSNIRRIAVLTQYKAHSLIRHLVHGWSAFQRDLGEFVEIFPASQRTSESWYVGTADAVFQNIDIIRNYRPRFVLVLAGDHVYKMDYGPMLARHVEKKADMTVGCIEVPLEDARGFGVMTVNEAGRIVRFDEKPAEPQPLPGSRDRALASMGIYVFTTDFLFQVLAEDANDEHSTHDFGGDIIPSVIEKRKVFAYSFRDPVTGAQAYWRDVGTIDAFWQANIELVSLSPELNLYDDEWPILTHQLQLPPAKFVFNDDGRRGMATDSMVSGGCIISGGRLNRTLLFSNVHIHSYSYIEDSVLLPGVDVGRHCRLKRTVIDRGTQIPQGMVIGEDLDEDRKRFRVTPRGVVLVTAEMLGQPERAGPMETRASGL